MTEFHVSEYRSENPQDHVYPGEIMPEWHLDAACRGSDPDLFFPERGASTRQAKAVCAECPVRSECLDYAIEAGERFGIWGGLSERARRKVREQRREAA